MAAVMVGLATGTAHGTHWRSTPTCHGWPWPAPLLLREPSLWRIAHRQRRIARGDGTVMHVRCLRTLPSPPRPPLWICVEWR